MNRQKPLIRPVRVLEPETARKIAAGEVIDRPAAIVRELLDNALDSGADSIQLEIENGGISLIRVVDNGCGMTAEDLKNCAQPHATSKIITDGDLLTLQTLGFRGEALASIAAVSELEITSRRNEEDHAWKLKPDIRGGNRVTPANLAQGTIVSSRGLFENIPARRSFLKRPAFEAQMCRQTFAEKSLPWNGVSFKLTADGRQKLFLPAGQPFSERFTAAMGISEPSDFFYEVTGGPGGENPAFSFSCVLCDSAVRRSDRKSIYVFINGRRIWEYSLVQAIEYGAQGYFPNGTFPVACLLLTIDPSLVDFNIHPAKKEVRFKDISPVHRAVSSAVRDFYKNRSIFALARLAGAEQGETNGGDLPESDSEGGSHSDSFSVNQQNSLFVNDGADSSYGGKYAEGGKAAGGEPAKNGGAGGNSGNRYSQSACFRQDKNENFRYGSILNKTAAQDYSRSLAEAVHEKFLQSSPPASGETGKKNAGNCYPYTGDEAGNGEKPGQNGGFRYAGTVLGVFLLAEKDDTLYLIDQHAAQERLLYDQFLRTSGEKQPLLFPYVIETANESDDRYLENLEAELEKAGFIIKNCGSGRWEVSAVPIKWNGTEEDLSRDLLEGRVQPEDLCRRLAAATACRAAVKDGIVLDQSAAISLIAQAFMLSDPHCPHGRPIWATITREELFKKVRRIESGG